MAVRLICSKCRAIPEPNKSLSNKNWNVIDNVGCKHCGGKLVVEIYDGRKRRK